MTLLTATTGSTHGLLPDEIGQLIVQPVRTASVALQVATVATTNSHEYRVPVALSDAGAAWTKEGDEIAPSDAQFDEIVVVPQKVAGLSIISRELASDSAPSAQQLVGQGLAQSLADKIDKAFFAAHTTNGPDGLLSVTDAQIVDTSDGIKNTDPFSEALSKAETVGGQITSFVANPADVLTLSKVKRQAGSNEPLLGYDASQPTKRVVLGVPLLSSPAVAAGDVWAIPLSKVVVVLREDVQLDVDRSQYFSSDRIGIRASMRIGYAFPHAATIIRLSAAGSA
ncbi:MAG: phage major capsid protein [Mycobacterium sp.]